MAPSLVHGHPAGKRLVVVRQALLSSVVVALLYFIYIAFMRSIRHTASSSGRNFREVAASDLGASSVLGLSRAVPAVHLEQKVDGDPMLGACYQQQPMLEGVPERACRNLRCLWSEAEQENVDLWLHPLHKLLGEAMAGKCPLPQGGQGPVPEGKAPLVSFVVTMHNNAQVTAQCLLELFRTAHEVPSAEYVLVNDGSTEDVSAIVQTAGRMQRLFGIKVVYLVNAEAKGYGPANTQAIEAASGEYIVLINNDLFVIKGWLSAIIQTFKTQPQAGIVGPVMLGANDEVQEAGGLVFADAQAANYGRGKVLSHGLYYLREVDYVSAACIAFRRDLFHKLGGFDDQYKLGYYEDTDFAMSVRASGLKVLLQPLAVVYHQEGTTFGTDATSDLKRQLMAENSHKFRRKWRNVLQAKHCPSEVDHLVAAGRYSSPKVLWVGDIVPEPDKDSGSIRNLNILKILLGEGYHVTFVPTVEGRDPHYVARARFKGVDVQSPITPPDRWQLVHGGRCMYDVIYVAHRTVYKEAREQLDKQCPGLPIIYDTVDLQFLQEARDDIASLSPEAKDAQDSQAWHIDSVTTARVLEWLDSDLPQASSARAKRDMELSLIDHSNLTVVVSPKEADVIHHYRQDAPVLVLSNIYDMPSPPKATCEGRTGLLFVGNMNHHPNRQAVEVLVRDVLPHLSKLLPEELRKGLVLHVVGADEVPKELEHLFEQSKGVVTFHGHLPNEELDDLYRQVKVVVAPLLSGAGVKGKVNQAMKMGVPVVATPLAVEEMHTQDGQDVLLASDPQSFATRLVEAYTDCALWLRLVDGGHRNIKQHFSVEMARPVVLQVYSSVGVGPTPGSLRSTCRPLSELSMHASTS